MSYDILYQRRGDQYISRHLKTVSTEKAARKIAADLNRFPADTIHIAVTCEDGRTILRHQQGTGIMTTTYWEDPADYPNAAQEREAELKTEIETLKFDLEQAEKAIDELEDARATGNRLIEENAALQGKVENMTSLLEEILEYRQDNYDVDPDPTGGHHDVPNWFMRIGTEIEDVLGRGGRHGF